MKLLAVLLVALLQNQGPIPTPGQGAGPIPNIIQGGGPVPFGQTADPDPPTPVLDPLHFDCVATGGGPKPIMLKAYWTDYPFESLKMFFSQVRSTSTDTTAPQISGVVMGLVNVLGNAGKIAAASNGAPFNVSAGDDVAITNASLYVDGIQTATAAELDGLPALFYLRWNARVVAPGAHAFRLIVWDAAGNQAEKTWSMLR